MFIRNEAKKTPEKMRRLIFPRKSDRVPPERWGAPPERRCSQRAKDTRRFGRVSLYEEGQLGTSSSNTCSSSCGGAWAEALFCTRSSKPSLRSSTAFPACGRSRSHTCSNCPVCGNGRGLPAHTRSRSPRPGDKNPAGRSRRIRRNTWRESTFPIYSKKGGAFPPVYAWGASKRSPSAGRVRRHRGTNPPLLVRPKLKIF